MNLVERAKNIMIAAGSEWVLWLLIGLSLASIAIIVERVLALRSLRADLDLLRKQLVDALTEGGFSRAREVMRRYQHPAARIVLRALLGSESEMTPKQAEDAMGAESIAQRRQLERRFNFLATLGANAPFIGLFGTVVGILKAFESLGTASAAQAASSLAPQAVMSSIAEALVATAVGLGVAIPAVFAFNLFQRTVKSAIDDAQILSLEVLSYLHAHAAVRLSSTNREKLDLGRTSVASQGPKSTRQVECSA